MKTYVISQITFELQHKTYKVKEMTDNRELNIVQIEATGFQDLCNRIAELEKENEFLDKQNKALKLRCGKYSLKIGELENEIADMKFTRKYLTSEEAGKAFARELLGKPMTHEEVVIENAENSYTPYSGDDF